MSPLQDVALALEVDDRVLVGIHQENGQTQPSHVKGKSVSEFEVSSKAFSAQQIAKHRQKT